MYIVEWVKDTESMRHNGIIKFETKEELEYWLLHKGFIRAEAIWKAERVNATPVTKQVPETIGYKIEKV